MTLLLLRKLLKIDFNQSQKMPGEENNRANGISA